MALIEKRKMNYHQYYPVDIVNGPGTRCTLFVSGCVHECPGCYNKSTWRLNSGMPFTAEVEAGYRTLGGLLAAQMAELPVPRKVA